MIKTVVKRNGSVEKYMPEKMHHWAYWADAKLNKNWDDILEGATSGMPESVSSSDLHSNLIDYCVSQRDEQSVNMAARLMLGDIYKEAYSNIAAPTLIDFYKGMVLKGYWEDKGYSDEELEILGSVIDHKKDYGYKYSTLKQFKDKYAVSAYGKCMETPQMAIMGVAMSNVSKENNRVSSAISLYKTLSNLLVNLPTPSLNGERTPQAASPSCCVITGDDDAESMAVVDTVAYDMTCNRSGIGAEKACRSPSDPVKGGTISHMGKYHYYDRIKSSVKANKQKSRGGSATVTFTCLDPEALSLVRLKSQRTAKNFQLIEMDYSMAMNKVFLKAVANNDDWMLVSVFYARKLHELFYSGNPKAFKEEYDKVLSDDSIKKTIIKARDLITSHLVEWFETGMIYSAFIDNINMHTPFKDPVRLSNLCVSGDTKILTKDGYMEIQSISGKSLEIWNGVEWSEADIVQTAQNAEVISVTVDSGESITCTPGHIFYLQSGKKVVAADLKEGDKLLPWVDNNGNRISQTVIKCSALNNKVDTYCFKESKKRMGVFNGILTGNCQEICLPTKGYDNIPALYEFKENGEIALCFLASIVVGNIETDEEYEEAAYQACKFIDNTIDKAVYPYESMRFTATKRRSIGVGMTDVAHWMAKNGYKYDTEEGRNALHRLAERHSYFLHKASVRLAKERGHCEWMDRTKYSDDKPWLPIDTYNKNIDNHHSQSLIFDWESLRTDIKEHGVRFSVHEAYMPVESSSVFTNSTNGVYPIREHQVFKRSPAGTVFFEAPEWSRLSDQYQRAWDISKFDMAKAYGIIQKFTGQSISADFYHDYSKEKKVSAIDMIKLYLFADSIGVKTFYYMNSVDSNNVDGHYEDRVTPEIEEACDNCKL